MDNDVDISRSIAHEKAALKALEKNAIAILKEKDVVAKRCSSTWAWINFIRTVGGDLSEGELLLLTPDTMLSVITHCGFAGIEKDEIYAFWLKMRIEEPNEIPQPSATNTEQLSVDEKIKKKASVQIRKPTSAYANERLFLKQIERSKISSQRPVSTAPPSPDSLPGEQQLPPVWDSSFKTTSVIPDLPPPFAVPKTKVKPKVVTRLVRKPSKKTK